MLSWVKAFLELVGEVFRRLNQRDLLDAGAAEEKINEVRNLERRVEDAGRSADPGVDPARAERLRKRFNRDGE